MLARSTGFQGADYGQYFGDLSKQTLRNRLDEIVCVEMKLQVRDSSGPASRSVLTDRLMACLLPLLSYNQKCMLDAVDFVGRPTSILDFFSAMEIQYRKKSHLFQ